MSNVITMQAVHCIWSASVSPRGAKCMRIDFPPRFPGWRTFSPRAGPRFEIGPETGASDPIFAELNGNELSPGQRLARRVSTREPGVRREDGPGLVFEEQ